MHARRVIGECGGVNGDRNVLIGASRHHAAHCLRKYVLPPFMGIGAALAIASTNGVDDARIQAPTFFISQTVALHYACTEVVDYDVRTRNQGLDCGHVLSLPHIECSTALVAVQAAKDGVVGASNWLEGRAA